MEDINYFGMRDHVMFLCYKDIIKLTYPVLYYELINDYYDDLKDYLELDKIKNFDIYNLERLSVERLDINPLKYIKKPNCSDELCDTLLSAFNDELIEMYTKSRFSDFGAKLYTVFPQNRVTDVYVYSEEPNYQILIDFDVHFSDYAKKIKFITGDFIEAVKSLEKKPTFYALNDISYVHRLRENDLVAYTEIVVAELGCNYELDKDFGMRLKGGIDEKIMKDEIFKLGVTPIVELKKEHFTNLDMNEFK
jgi:hypothetical protein